MNECVICGSTFFNPIFKINNMPVFMGAVNKKKVYEHSDMTFVECKNCQTIQIEENIDLSNYTWPIIMSI